MMKHIFIAVIISLSLSNNVFATEDVKIKDLIAIKISDWNNDASVDKAILAKSSDTEDDDAVLYLFISDNDGEGTIIEKRNIAWYGSMWGTIPELSINKSGSLVVHSMNDAIGRDRWMKQLTISYRENEFIISGYTYSSRDTLKPNSDFKCDVNFLTGKGIKKIKPFMSAQKNAP